MEILEENKQHVTAKTLVEDVVRMVKSKTRSTWYGRQNPTYLCVPNNIEEIGVIGGCGEEELMEVDSPVQSPGML